MFMRDITKNTWRVWENKACNWHLSNTTVTQMCIIHFTQDERAHLLDTALVLSIFGNAIAVKLNEGMTEDTYFYMHGFRSATTKERLKAIGLNLHNEWDEVYHHPREGDKVHLDPWSMYKYDRENDWIYEEHYTYSAMNLKIAQMTSPTVFPSTMEKLRNGDTEPFADWFKACLYLSETQYGGPFSMMIPVYPTPSTNTVARERIVVCPKHRTDVVRALGINVPLSRLTR